MENLSSVLGCRIGKLPTSYLGLPLGALFKSSRAWDIVEETIPFQGQETYFS